MQHPVDMVNC